jgi:hypothetical protein
VYIFITVKDKDLKEYRSVRGTLFVGILLTTGAIITAILVLFVLKDKKILYFLAAGLDVAAGKKKFLYFFFLDLKATEHVKT